MWRDRDETFELTIRDVEEGPIEDGYRPVSLVTSRGDIACRFYQARGTQRAALWVGGVGGGWDTPARGLYPRLCEDLVGERVASLRVRFRQARVMEEAALDVLAGIHYLESVGVESIALVGHSFGGAVVIQAAASAPATRAVVTLATQSYGIAPVALLAPRCSILLVHGASDRVLPLACSQYAYRLAQEPRRLVIYEAASHSLDEVADLVYELVRGWIIEQLSAASPGG